MTIYKNVAAKLKRWYFNYSAVLFLCFFIYLFLHIGLQVMLLTAIKEINVKKGASITAIFKNVHAIYKYDIQRNRRILKRTLEKLIAEKVVEQVKGHGLAGSFRLGRNYKEQKFCNKAKKQVSWVI